MDQWAWSHLFELVIVLMFRISLGLWDMVNVGGALISLVGIFVMFCNVAGHGDIYIYFL